MQSIAFAVDALTASGTFDSLLDADVEFQTCVLKASLNPMFTCMRSIIHPDIAMATEYYRQSKKGLFIDTTRYMSVLNAIQSGNCDSSEEAMRTFLQYNDQMAVRN